MTDVYELDGNQLRLLEPEQTHAYLKEMLGLPEHYGRNADALMDCLTELSGETMIWISDADAMHPKLTRVFTEAMEKNPHLTVILMEDSE